MESSKRPNPIVIGSIVSRSPNSEMEQFTNQNTLSMSYSIKRGDSINRDNNTQKTNNISLKEIRQMTERIGKADLSQNSDYLKCNPSGKFLKTRDEEQTMFSKMLLKTR